MTWAISTFRDGSSTAFVSQATIALVGAEHQGAHDALWRMVAADAALDDILDELSGQGLRGLPPFAMARFEDDGVRVVTRGAMVVEVRTDDDVVRVEAIAVRTWREEFIDGPAVVRLVDRSPDADDEPGAGATPRFEVLAGVVPAASIERDLRVADPRAEVAAAEWDPVGVVADEPIDAPPAPAPEFGVEPERQPEPERESEPEPAPEPELEPSTGAAPAEVPEDSDQTLVPADLDGVEPPWAEEPPAAAPAEPTGDDDYDHLFGQTMKRTVEGAAVRVDDDAESELIDAIPSTAPPDDPASPPPPPQDPSPAPDPTPAPAQLGDHDGHTISRAQLAAMQAGDAAPSASPEAAPGAPTVSAVTCVSGHPNPPQAASCRICGAAPSSGAPVTVPRPPLGVVVLSTGDRIVVDRPLVIGRNPKVGPSSFGELPRLVKLESAGPGLSRTHAEVRIEQWQMLLVDSRSSNGTEITLPGHPPRRLHADEAVGLVPGAQVDLGGEITFVVEEVR